MPVQVRPDEMIALLEGDFQRRYEPNFSWKSAAAVLRGLPGIRGAWTMGSFDENGDQFDGSGQGRTLSYQGNPAYGYANLVPYLDMDGAGDYLSRADEAGLDILGTETYVTAAQRGVTLGGWFKFDRLTNAEQLIGKADGVIANSSYWITFRGDVANDPFQFTISDGAAADNLLLTLATAPTTGLWTFIVGRYTPSTEIAVFASQAVGLLENDTVVAGIPAALNNGNASFAIGANSAAANPLDGMASLCFLCAQSLSDAIITATWEQTRAMFGG